MLKSLDSVSNFIRATVSLAVLGLVGGASWLGYNTYYARELQLQQQQNLLRQTEGQLQQSQAQIVSLNADLQVKQIEIDRLDTAVRLLKVDHRLAQIEVLDQQTRVPGDRSTLTTRFNFVEIDADGQPLDKPREFEIEGDVVYIDAWVVKFEDALIEQADPLRATSVCLFRRLFGEQQEPQEGFELDAVGSRPAAYSRGEEVSELEQELWENFWEYATNPEKAEAAGVRAAHGEAPSIKLRPDKRYKVELRASGGLTIIPENVQNPEPPL